MKTIFRHRGVGGLLAAQAQVAFNDNATKLVLMGLAQWLLPARGAERATGLISLLLVTPFVLFAPLSGWLADRFPKRHVLAASLWMQLAIMFVLLGAAIVQSLPVAIGGFFLLGIQSALMAPVRRGMVKDLAEDNVGEVIGWMDMLCIAAILGGSLAGSQAIDGLAQAFHSPWAAALAALGALALSCAGALWIFRRVPVHPAAGARPFGHRVLWGHADLFASLRRDRGIWRAALGDSTFYLAGGVLLLALAQVGRGLHPDGAGATRATGLMLALVGMGIAAGSVGAACLNRRRINLGLVPPGALVMAGMFLLLATLPAGGAGYHFTLFALGLGGGLYLVPLGAFLVDRTREEERGKILAASSMLSSLAGIAAVGLHLLAAPLGPQGQFALLGGLFILTALLSTRMLSQDVLRLIALALSRLRYGVKAEGIENLPARGGALLVCNHVSYVDTIALSLASPRPIRFLSYANFFQAPVLGGILRIFRAIPVSPTHAKDALRRAAEAIQAGELVCIFPEGQLTRTGCLMELKSGFEIIARRTQCPVVVAHLDGLWGSIHSFAGGRYFTKWPRGLRRRITVSFGRPVEASTEGVRRTMLELGAAALGRRTENTLTHTLLEALSGNPFRTALRDGQKALPAGDLLGLALALSRRPLPGKRVGVLLPPGAAGTIANLGLLLAGKVPVNLNPTQSTAASQHCLEQAGIETVLASRLMRERFPKFPWPETTRLIESELAAARKWRWLAAAYFVPTGLLARRLPRAMEDEAVLLFTSGSSGLPKGVPLAHRHLLTNLRQVTETGLLAPRDRLLTALPLFHSFGLTMGLFLPLATRRAIITAPSPLDCEKLAEAARGDAPTVLLTTPTFMRHYLKRVARDAFGTLRLAACGAEKLPEDLRAAFRARFGCEVLEGYGLTEASPVATFNLPHPARGLGADSFQPGGREGSVGRLLPGVAYRLFDMEANGRGQLALRGGNIITRYLGGEHAEKFRDGWYLTGDLARIDADGFVFLQGRGSRFSKIGGEMVSHAAVEEALAPHETCVIGLPSAEKGEELALLTPENLTREDIRALLQKSGAPNLWIPRHIRVVPGLPVLASGKRDLAACRRLAEDTAALT